MEFAAFVALRSTLSILRFSRTELSKVFSSLWGGIGEELNLNTAKWFSLKYAVRTNSFLEHYVGTICGPVKPSGKSCTSNSSVR